MIYRFLFLFLFLIVIIICWCVGSTSESYNAFNRTLETKKYYKEIQTATHYVCWTGGYDSTFRVSQLICARKRVQPIYLSMDDVDDHKNKPFRVQRKNRENELRAIRKIRRLLEELYPQATYLLLPTLYINQLGEPNLEIQKCAAYLYSKLGWFTRKVNQYERILQVAFKLPEPLEICVENADDGLSRSIKKFVVGAERNCRLTHKLPNKYKCACIFGMVRFPIIHLTKKEMLGIAVEEGYEKVLEQSWSCWTPITVNGKSVPCGRCDMCRHRIKIEK